ncbi:hypothetical protein EHS25_002256 [Saitozyma podzolica]|uniref:Transcription factor domain-containing protein n=1 Tax=Saitozyma podzolica TaxID=1890683 RepID=A0A427YEV5_9TREE|nr:hypothetical protein EHS25_002256 [Saitozyma podzolica]
MTTEFSGEDQVQVVKGIVHGDLGPTLVKLGKAVPISCAECRRLKASSVQKQFRPLADELRSNVTESSLIDQVKSLKVSSTPVASSGGQPSTVSGGDPPPLHSTSSAQFGLVSSEPWPRADYSPDVAERSRLPFPGQSGTLAVSQSGRIKFVGASAGAMSLRERLPPPSPTLRRPGLRYSDEHGAAASSSSCIGVLQLVATLPGCRPLPGVEYLDSSTGDGAPSDVVIYTCPVSHRASYSSLDGGRDLAWQMWGNALNPHHFDTQYPVDYENPLGDAALCGFSVMRYEIARIVQDILDHALDSDNPSYGSAIGLWQRVTIFEDTTPFRLRCRSAMRANITRYPTQEEADLASPEPQPDDMRLCFQQHALAQGSCAAIFSILRPFFVAALSQNADNPIQTPYGQAYLVMLITLVENLYSLAPVISARHWFFWAHAFNAGLCLATLCIASPGNPLAPLALSRLSNVQALLHQVSQTLNLPLGGISKNIECLRSLEKHSVRNRTAFLENRPVQGSGLRTNLELVNNGTPLPNEVDPSALIGWQTRLVKMSPDEPQEGTVLVAGNAALPGPLPAIGRLAIPHASPNINIGAGPISNDSLVNRSHSCQELDNDLGDWTDPDTVRSD